jgi:hypothetical protein
MRIAFINCVSSPRLAIQAQPLCTQPHGKNGNESSNGTFEDQSPLHVARRVIDRIGTLFIFQKTHDNEEHRTQKLTACPAHDGADFGTNGVCYFYKILQRDRNERKG